MDENTVIRRPSTPDWLSITNEELVAYRDAENRFRASSAARSLTGEPDPDACIEWKTLTLSGRTLPVRIYRSMAGNDDGDRDRKAGSPLVLHVHGGGFVGTAVQSDWVNSHLATQVPAIVVSVEHRLLSADTPLSAAVDDLWGVLRHITDHAGDWGVDPARIAVFGERCGALISALVALRAARAGTALQAQVLVNPVVDVSDTMSAYPSMSQFAHTPTCSTEALQLIQRFAVPPGTDSRSASPLYADDLGEVAPALVIVPTDDPLADQGRRYAERLQSAGVTTEVREFHGACHAFLSLPGREPQAIPARAAVRAFLQSALSCPTRVVSQE
jgi:acetyl esterase